MTRVASSSVSNPTSISTVILTRGDRPAELATAIESARRAAHTLGGRRHEVVVVWNGVTPDPSIDADITVAAAENLGIPGGRNLGMRASSGDLVLFLDDDAAVAADIDLASVASRFETDDRLGIVAMRLHDESGRTARRHVPRPGGRSALRPGTVAQYLGGASIHRRAAFDDAGGYADEFFYAMEETDLALRLVDRDHRIDYEPTLAVFHPATDPSRHAGSIQRTARNRVWLAHRNLPLLVAITYVSTWTVVSLARNLRSASGLGAVVSGTADGVRRPLGPRRPIRWRTVWRLTRLGRPPIL